MIRRTLIASLILLAALALPRPVEGDVGKRLLIYGASGRIGVHIVEEALMRGYDVTGVTRSPVRLEPFSNRINIEVGDILDRDRTEELIAAHDAVIVSVGGKPASQDPERYIAALAAESLIEVLARFGEDGPRLIFVGNLFTLIYEDGKTLLELGRVAATHENYAMFHGHQIALDRFRQTDTINWTVASPPNGLRLEGRTEQLRWGGDVLLRDPDGKPSQISLEDFAVAVLYELEHGNYVRQRFNVAR